jgi:hypothetical protein
LPSETTLESVAGKEPNLTPVAPVKPVPVIVTSVPPATGPEAGLIAETTGAALLNTQTAPLLVSSLPPISAVRPPPESATLPPNAPFPTSPPPVSFAPCWTHAVPERPNAQAAPLTGSSLGPPIRAVLPSAESATLRPNSPMPISPPPVSLPPC